MRKGVYEIEILHARTKPVAQSFQVRGYSIFADLADFSGDTMRLGWGHSFRRADFSLLADTTKTASAAALAYLHKESKITADQVFLLANPRICGYVFNPVSFFFCYRRGVHVVTVLEVNNTFGEQKHFIIPAEDLGAESRKNFYVSPFLSVFSDFRMRIEPPQAQLSIGIHTIGKTGTELVAEMRGSRYGIGRFTLARFFLKYPFHTVRVIVLIHWYALRLFLAKVPHFPKANADAALLHNTVRSRY